MAMQQPVVVSDTAVHREYLGDFGLYVSPGDVPGMASRIADTLNDPVRGKKLGEELRKRAIKNFSWEKAGKKIDSLYQTLDKGNTRV